MDKSNENYIEPDTTVEYLFIEYTEKQAKPINEDQGWVCGFINIFRNPRDFNDDLTDFKNVILEELGNIVSTYENFNVKQFDLEQYKFVLVENGKIGREFQCLGEDFYTMLRTSSHNLMIVGKNLDVGAFIQHELFQKWVEEYCNP